MLLPVSGILITCLWRWQAPGSAQGSGLYTRSSSDTDQVPLWGLRLSPVSSHVRDETGNHNRLLVPAWHSLQFLLKTWEMSWTAPKSCIASYWRRINTWLLPSPPLITPHITPPDSAWNYRSLTHQSSLSEPAEMQVMPPNPFLPSLLHQQFLARGLSPAVAARPSSDPTTPPSSEDNMSPPPSFSARHLDDEGISEKQVRPSRWLRFWFPK